MRPAQGELARSCDAIISRLRTADEILIFGRGEAKNELKKRLEQSSMVAEQIFSSSIRQNDRLTRCIGINWFGFGAYAAHPTTISQTIATVAGGNYQLLFDYADDGSSGGLTVTLDGTTLATVSPSGSVQSDTVSFTATANNEQLVFAGYNQNTWTYLDNISVAVVPEPAATGALASMGLVAISVCSAVRLAVRRIRIKRHHSRTPIPTNT